MNLGMWCNTCSMPDSMRAAKREGETVGADHAVVVQNFIENFAMLRLKGLHRVTDKYGFLVVRSSYLAV